MVRTRGASESFHWFTETCSTGTGFPAASNASKRRTNRPMSITWYVPGAVAANW